MANTLKYIGLGAVVIGVGYGAYYLWKKHNQPKSITEPQPETKITTEKPVLTEKTPQPKVSKVSIPTGTKKVSVHEASAGFPLKYGSRGKEVVFLQKYLNLVVGNGITEDGIFGNQTEQALKRIAFGDTIDANEYKFMQNYYANNQK